MKLIRTIFIFLVLGVCGSAAAQSAKYKCMIQMNNYTGEGAYIVVSLIKKDGSYARTLRLFGPDKKWYPDWKEWHKANGKKANSLSGITSASVSGGDRAVVTLEFDKAMMNGDYKLRFESAVEDKNYHAKDVEIPLTAAALAAKTDGTGYIRYVRFSAN